MRYYYSEDGLLPTVAKISDHLAAGAASIGAPVDAALAAVRAAENNIYGEANGVRLYTETTLACSPYRDARIGVVVGWNVAGEFYDGELAAAEALRREWARFQVHP